MPIAWFVIYLEDKQRKIPLVKWYSQADAIIDGNLSFHVCPFVHADPIRIRVLAIAAADRTYKMI